MRKGQGFLVGVLVVAFSFALAGQAAAAPAPDFTFGSASVNETVYTFNSAPVSCADFPAASDSYQWEVKLAKIKSDFTQDLANNVVIVAFNSGSCNPIDDVTNTIEISPGGAYIHPDSLGLMDVDFDGAVPDFNSYNSSDSLPYFDQIGFHMVYNPNGSTTGGLKPGAGTLQVTGNANLCGAITSTQPQECFILDLTYGDPAPSAADFSCICVTPSVVSVDITSILQP